MTGPTCPRCGKEMHWNKWVGWICGYCLYGAGKSERGSCSAEMLIPGAIIGAFLLAAAALLRACQ